MAQGSVDAVVDPFYARFQVLWDELECEAVCAFAVPVGVVIGEIGVERLGEPGVADDRDLHRHRPLGGVASRL